MCFFEKTNRQVRQGERSLFSVRGCLKSVVILNMLRSPLTPLSKGGTGNQSPPF